MKYELMNVLSTNQIAIYIGQLLIRVKHQHNQHQDKQTKQA